MFKMVKRNEKGFTLIELMIVIAIIGILAAIAIPQFAAYRTKSYNSSSQSDVRNLATSQAAFYSDWQAFGLSAVAAAASAGGAGAVLVGPGSTATLITAADPGDATIARSTQIGLGNGIRLISTTNAGGAAIVANSTFIGISKHDKGDTYYGVDSDTSAVYQSPVAGSAGTPLAAGFLPIASTIVDNFDGVGAWVTK